MKVISATIKQYLPHIVGFCVIMILVFFVLQTQRASKYYNKYLVSEGDFQAKNQAYIDLKEKTGSEKEVLAKERDKEKKAREKTDDEIKEIRAAGRKKDRELVKAKAKIQELTPDELTTQLNSRVPGQYTLLSTEDFSLTRYGGELTLGLFMDGERCAGALSERDSTILTYKNKEISFNVTIDNLKIDLKKTEDALDGPEGCNKALLAAIKAKEDLHKAFKAMKWKQLGKGALGGGLLVVVILKIAGVI